MATIDDIIAGLIAFRDTTYSKLNALQADINALTDPNKKIKIYSNCHKCHGDGMVWDYGGIYGIHPLDVVDPPPETPPSMVCPFCKGSKRIVWGWQETDPEEAP